MGLIRFKDAAISQANLHVTREVSGIINRRVEFVAYLSRESQHRRLLNRFISKLLEAGAATNEHDRFGDAPGKLAQLSLP